MRVLMLGWEFPPHISGGLGTACEGLTAGLARQGADITFVVPELFGGECARDFYLVDSLGRIVDEAGVLHTASGSAVSDLLADCSGPGRVRHQKVPAMLAPYFTPELFRSYIDQLQIEAQELSCRGSKLRSDLYEAGLEAVVLETNAALLGNEVAHYRGDMFEEVGRYATQISDRFSSSAYDVIHCHDWMTFPAGMMLKEKTGYPLVTHIHSAEYDRSGAWGNERICEIERWGLEVSDAVVAVSNYTRRVLHEQYHIPLEKVAVVHNGVKQEPFSVPAIPARRPPSRVVLYLGRMTMQKGPDYFVEAAAKVVTVVPDVLFVMAGSGDMRQRLMDRVSELGLEDQFQFPGFLKGREVEDMFSIADVYVMPSVSEPFGISALEAIKYGTPAIISKQSGVSEVLTHALKVDFWDVDRLADFIINAITHEELRDDMLAMAQVDVRRLDWGTAASRTLEVYNRVC